MNPMMNLNMMVEKELDLERQGVPRTRRWIGDASPDADPQWYQSRMTKVLAARDDQDEVNRGMQTQNNILVQLSNLFTIRPQAQQPCLDCP